MLRKLNAIAFHKTPIPFESKGHNARVLRSEPNNHKYVPSANQYFVKLEMKLQSVSIANQYFVKLEMKLQRVPKKQAPVLRKAGKETS